MGKIDKNFSLIAAIFIPILTIVAVIASIYFPSLFFKPKYDFLYVVDEPYYGSSCSEHSYSVINQRLETVSQQINSRCYSNTNPTTKLYRHHVSENRSILVSLSQAQSLRLDPNLKSPDGYEIASSGGGGFFFFYTTGDYGARYLKGSGSARKLNLQVDKQDSYKFRFLGWVLD